MRSCISVCLYSDRIWICCSRGASRERSPSSDGRFAGHAIKEQASSVACVGAFFPRRLFAWNAIARSRNGIPNNFDLAVTSLKPGRRSGGKGPPERVRGVGYALFPNVCRRLCRARRPATPRYSLMPRRHDGRGSLHRRILCRSTRCFVSELGCRWGANALLSARAATIRRAGHASPFANRTSGCSRLTGPSAGAALDRDRKCIENGRHGKREPSRDGLGNICSNGLRLGAPC